MSGIACFMLAGVTVNFKACMVWFKKRRFAERAAC